jgi:integrase/recombinase XerD
LRRFPFHDLRHWHAVQWLKQFHSIYDLQHRRGHSSIKTIQMYCEYLTPDEQRVADATAFALRGRMQPKALVDYQRIICDMMQHALAHGGLHVGSQTQVDD